MNHAGMSTAIQMRQIAFENEGDGFKTAMRMRAERQALIIRRVMHRPMVIEKQERIQLRQTRAGQGTARDEIADIIAMGGM